jgi:hypothetical protein
MKINVFRKFVIAFVLVTFFTCFFVISKNTVSASGGSITMTNCYPINGETYQVVDHFTEQILSVNTNTTVSVSIDGEKPIPMIYKGLVSKVAAGDSVAQNWYTWENTIPPLTAPGLHSFQFLGKYYVWQETDQYWAEFNYSSNVGSFIIENPAVTIPGNNRSDLTNKELSLSTPEAIALKMPQATISNTETRRGIPNGPDSALAFFIGTICAVVGAVLIVAIVVIQILSRGRNGLTQSANRSQN